DRCSVAIKKVTQHFFCVIYATLLLRNLCNTSFAQFMQHFFCANYATLLLRNLCNTSFAQITKQLTATTLSSKRGHGHSKAWRTVSFYSNQYFERKETGREGPWIFFKILHFSPN